MISIYSYKYKVEWSRPQYVLDFFDYYQDEVGVYLFEGPHPVYSNYGRTLLYIGQSKVNLQKEVQKQVSNKLLRFYSINPNRFGVRFGKINVLKVPKPRKDKRVWDCDIDFVESALIYYHLPALNGMGIENWFDGIQVTIVNSPKGFLKEEFTIDP